MHARLILYMYLEDAEEFLNMRTHETQPITVMDKRNDQQECVYFKSHKSMGGKNYLNDMIS